MGVWGGGEMATGTGAKLGSRQTQGSGGAACRQGAAKTFPRVGTLGLGSRTARLRRCQQLIWPGPRQAAGSWVGARAERFGFGERLRAPRPQPGGRVSGLLPPLATLGSGPTTPGGVRAFSSRVLCTSRVSASSKFHCPLSLPRGRSGGASRDPWREARWGGESGRHAGGGRGLEWGIRGTLRPRLRPHLSSPSEPEEQGSMDQTLLLCHHDARPLSGGSGFRGAPRSGRFWSSPQLSPPPPLSPFAPSGSPAPLLPSHPAAATEDASVALSPARPAPPARAPCPAPARPACWAHPRAAPRGLPGRRALGQRDGLRRPVSVLGRGATLPRAVTPGELGSAARAAPQLLPEPGRRGQTLVLPWERPRQGGLGLLRLQTRWVAPGQPQQLGPGGEPAWRTAGFRCSLKRASESVRFRGCIARQTAGRWVTGKAHWVPWL